MTRHLQREAADGTESRLPLRDVVATELRTMILKGRLRPGERLGEDRLAELLGVSRNPVREAIRSLEAEGFVETTARRGAFVAELSETQAADLFEVRLVLEPLGAKLAARRESPQLIAQMREIMTTVDRTAKRAGLDELASLHTTLHALIFEMTGNGYLTAIAIPMVRRGQWLLRRGAEMRDPSAWSEHHGLIDAIESGDADLAEVVAKHHVLSVRSSMRADD